LRRIAAAKAQFISRSDRSGTHAAELSYWKDAGVDLAAIKGDWYKGIGPALNIASAHNGYLLTDPGTWLSFENPGDLTILVERD
jgi:tungstate transport system substrate-binding protein